MERPKYFDKRNQNTAGKIFTSTDKLIRNPMNGGIEKEIKQETDQSEFESENKHVKNLVYQIFKYNRITGGNNKVT